MVVRDEWGIIHDFLLETVLKLQQWNEIIGGDAAETGAGPGSYDIRKSVWHVNVSTDTKVNDLCNHTNETISAVARK